MSNAKILVVYYSRTGVTAQMATRLAGRLGADIEEIVDRTDRSGPSGFVRSMIDALAERSIPIGAAVHDPASYSIVVIATPVWAHHVAAPVRTWLGAYRNRLHRVAFLCTLGGSGANAVFEQMARLSGKSPVARCKIDAHDLRDHASVRLLDVFCDRLSRKLEHVKEIEWAC